MRNTVALVGIVPFMVACSTAASEPNRNALQTREDSGQVPDPGHHVVPGTGGAHGHIEAGARLPDAGLHPTCVLSRTSTIPNVHIEFPSNDCVFSLAQARAGILIRYDVIIDADTPFTPARPSAYGPGPAFGEPSKEEHHWASALDLNERLEGNGQSYCLCDLGLPYPFCPGADAGVYHSWQEPCSPATLIHGTYPVAFYWDGVNWGGPSDTGNPKGAPFPAGDYTLTVSTAKGLAGTSGDAGTVEASARILVRLVP